MTRSRSPVAFGPYIITRRIARGGMAEIYRARTRSTVETASRWVAVKMMRSAIGHEELRENLFKREARIASMINHPNVIPLVNFGHEMERYYIAMEYVLGRDLSHLLRDEKKGTEILPFELALFVGFEAAGGLGHAHQLVDDQGAPLGIVHRDISPGNVMVGYDGSVKVLDFGVARMNESEGMRTQTGTLRGKFAYMSPEQTLGEALDAKSDVFSLGTVLYELLTGSNCFRADNPIATLERVQRVRPVPPSRANREVPKAVDRILARCLAKDRGRRYADGLALREALGEFLDKRNFDGRAALRDLMGERFRWEKQEEEKELLREEEEVALFDIVDFAQIGDDATGLDAPRVAVSMEEEASQAEVARQLATDDDDKVFDSDENEDARAAETGAAAKRFDDPDDAAIPGGGAVELASLLASPTPQAPPTANAELLGILAPAGMLNLAGESGQSTQMHTVQEAAKPVARPSRVMAYVAVAAAAVLAIAGVVAAGIESQSADAAQAPVVEPARPTQIAPVKISVDKEAKRTRPEPKMSEVFEERRDDGEEQRAERISAEREKQREEEKKKARPRPTTPVQRGFVTPQKTNKASPKAKVGFLNVGATPWGTITIDGRAWPYQTPQAGIELSPGRHEITLFNRDTGVRQSRTVTIRAGAASTVNVDLRRR